MGSAKDAFRVEYAGTKDLEAAMSAMRERIRAGEYDGRFYRVTDDIRQLPDGRIQMKTVTQNGEHEVGVVRFNLERGDAEYQWHDGDPDE